MGNHNKIISNKNIFFFQKNLHNKKKNNIFVYIAKLNFTIHICNYFLYKKKIIIANAIIICKLIFEYYMKNENINEEVNKRFAEIVYQYFGTIKEMVERTGITSSSIYRILDNNMNVGAAARKGLQKININFNWLDYGEGEMFKNAADNKGQEPIAEPFKIKLANSLLNAGSSLNLKDSSIEQYYHVSYRFRDALRYIAFRINGNDMFNRNDPKSSISDKSIVICDMRVEVATNDIVVVIINNLIYCRVYTKNSDGSVVFTAHDPTIPSMKINGIYNTYQIIGKVVFSGKEY